MSVPGNLAKLISAGKPVNPATAATAFGPQQLLYSGDATGFLTNQGSLGGTLANCLASFNVTGSVGAGPCTCSNATVGAAVFVVLNVGVNPHTDDTSQFESTISVNGQIQQISSNDNSGNSYGVYTVNGAAITNAATHP